MLLPACHERKKCSNISWLKTSFPSGVLPYVMVSFIIVNSNSSLGTIVLIFESLFSGYLRRNEMPDTVSSRTKACTQRLCIFIRVFVHARERDIIFYGESLRDSASHRFARERINNCRWFACHAKTIAR